MATIQWWACARTYSRDRHSVQIQTQVARTWGKGECLVEDRGKDRHVWKWEEERSKPHLVFNLLLKIQEEMMKVQVKGTLFASC